MEIKDLQTLQKLITFCGKQGVTSIRLGDLEIKLGPTPTKTGKTSDYSMDFPEANIKVPQFQGYSAPIAENALSNLRTDAEEIVTQEPGLTQEQLLFYSSQGHIGQ